MEKGGSMPARKISFKRNFEVKCFKKEEEPATVGKSKSYRDKYNDKIHYSWRSTGQTAIFYDWVYGFFVWTVSKSEYIEMKYILITNLKTLKKSKL